MSRAFLNRRQLWLLIMLLPGVILLLSLLGPLPSRLELQISEDRRLYQVRESHEHYRLRLLLPLPEPDTPAHWLSYAVLPDVLQQRLQAPATQTWLQQQGWQAQAQRSDTFWQLRIIAASAPDSFALNRLFQLLTAPVEQDWRELINRHVAARYLRLQAPEEAALSALHPGPLPDTWSSSPAEVINGWLAVERWQLILLTPEFLALESPTAAATGPLSQTRLEVRPLPSASPAGAGSLQHWRWPNPDNLAEVAKTYMALACVQQQLTGLSRAEFRLRWRVWDRHSTLDLLLADPGLTPQQLLGCPDAEAFVRLRQQQVEHWQTRLDTDLSHWVQLLAQYRLPAAEPGQLIRQLEQLERDEVQHHLQRLASSDTYRRLIFPPATEDPHAPSQ